jgi:hypothetical protein
LETATMCMTSSASSASRASCKDSFRASSTSRVFLFSLGPIQTG